MLGGKQVAAMLAVRDLDVAREFYGNVLGLTPVDESSEAITFVSGGSAAVVYRSEYAGTNQATAAAWAAGDDFDAVLGELRAKGVAFEHYDDLPGVTREGDVHTMGPMRAAWLKDPDGNILSIVDQAM